MNQTPIVTGPFSFKEWKRGSFIRLVRYDGYWKPGQVQLTAVGDIEPFDVPRFQQQLNLDFTTRGWEYFSPLMWLKLNHRVKPLDDVRLRQALSFAIDRDFVLKRLWFGVGKVATGPVAPVHRGARHLAERLKPDRGAGQPDSRERDPA